MSHSNQTLDISVANVKLVGQLFVLHIQEAKIDEVDLYSKCLIYWPLLTAKVWGSYGETWMRYNRKSIGAVSGWLAESRAGCRNEQCLRYKVLRGITQGRMAISILSIWLQAKRTCQQSPSFPNVDPIIYMQHCCICRKSSPLQFILRKNDYMIVLLLLGYQKKKIVSFVWRQKTTRSLMWNFKLQSSQKTYVGLSA